MRGCRSLFFPFFLVLHACGDPAPAAPPASASASASAPASKPGADEAKAEAEASAKPKPAKAHVAGTIPHKRPKPTSEEVDAALARAKIFPAKLNAGRKAVKAGDFDAAFAAFADARELRPHDASVLGESGFAALKAGKLDEARRWTEAAIGRAHKPRRLGALFYNLGLIAEAGGDPAAAKQHYERSLSLRPNGTVRGKLAALTEVAAPSGAQDLGAYCEKRAAEEECMSEAESEAMAEESGGLEEYWCGCAITEHIKAEPHDGPILEAAILLIGVEEKPYMIESRSVLAIKTREGGWQEVHAVLNSWMKEFIDSETDDGQIASVEFRDITSAPGLELIAHYDRYHNDPPDLDTEETDMVDTNERGTVLCGGPEPGCGRWQTYRSIATSEYEDWDYGEPTTSTTELNTEFTGEGVKLSVKTGSATDESWKGLEGTHSFEQVFSSSVFSPARLR